MKILQPYFVVVNIKIHLDFSRLQSLGCNLLFFSTNVRTLFHLNIFFLFVKHVWKKLLMGFLLKISTREFEDIGDSSTAHLIKLLF